MEDQRFDEIAKSFAASGLSRRQMLRRFAAGLMGAVIAGVLPERTWAAAGGNSACAHFCAMVFGADTPEAGQCTSLAAHNKGLCYTCGPGSTTGQVLCGTTCCAVGENCCSGVCSNLATDVLNCGGCGNACLTGQMCVSGQCVCPTDTVLCGGQCVSTTCPSGQVFDATTCSCVSSGANQPCTTFACGSAGPCAPAPNASPPDCFCFEVAETPGQGICLGNFFCNSAQSCTATTDCPTGMMCVVNTCCGPQGVCAPACPPPGTSSIAPAFSGGRNAGGV